MLEVEDLCITMGDTKAVQGVSFSIKAHERIALVGESGSGKSTIGKAIPALLPPHEQTGKILFEGRDISDLKEKEMRKMRGSQISLVLQDPMTSLNPTMKAGPQVEEALRAHEAISHKEAKKRVLAIFEKLQFNYPERVYKAYPHTLSGGMRQRVALAIALICGPKLLIADEVTTALDVTIQAEILELLRREFKETALLWITHDLSVATTLCDQIIVLKKGKIVETGTVKKLFLNPKQAYTQNLLEAIPKL